MREGPYTIQGGSPCALWKPGRKNVMLNGVTDHSHGLGLWGLVDLSLPLESSNNLKRSFKEVPPAPRDITSELGESGLVVFPSIKLV